jgi:hypothetical protein
MYLKEFESIVMSMHDNRFMQYQMISSLEDKAFVKAMEEHDTSFNLEEHKEAIFKMIGMQEYVTHIVEMHYINPLTELKKKIEDYKNGVFVDDWGRRLDEMYGDDPEHERCEKDFWEYLIHKFSSDEDKHLVCKKADIPVLVLTMWSMSRKLSTGMTEGLIKFFNPTILVPDGDDSHREMSQSEKDNYGLDKALQSIEKEFSLLSYTDFCELALKIAHAKGDVDLIYDAI